MIRLITHSIFLAFSIVGLACGLHAQTAKPPVKAVETAIKPDSVKIPAFSVRFGPYTAKTPTPVEDIKKAAGAELIIIDQQGQRWTTIAFRFVWNRKELTDDWKTGKRKTIMMYNAVEIDGNSRIPESWQKELNEFLQTGEEIIFERIIAEHPGSKRKMIAPDLKLKII